MDELMKIVEEGLESEKMRILAKVEEELESAKVTILTKMKRYVKDGYQRTSARTKMKLELRNGIGKTILTGEEIRGEGGVPIEVALVDDLAGDVVDAEPEASAKVEIVLLKGGGPEGDDDWTAEEFNANIVPEVEGKQPILAGNVSLQLQKGIGILQNIKFRHHASKIKPSEFQLGARVVGTSDGGCRIKEAKTEPFTLKDFRAKYYKKCENPSLSDEVSRLVYICRGGKIHKRLQAKNIFNVEDFLIQLLINPQGLKSIVKSQAKMWEAIVNNARACLGDKRVYCYTNMKQKTGITFNILGNVLGLYPGGYYSQTSTLSEKQKADAEVLLASAYKNWEEVKAFDDQNSVEQHLSCLYSTDPSENMGASESSSRRSNFSLQSACSTMNYLYGEDVGSLSDDIDTVFDAAMLYIHAWPCSPSLFEGYSMQLDNVAASVEPQPQPQVVNMCRSNAPKRWTKLLCVSKWFSLRKRVAMSITPHRKKQKLE